MGQTDTETGATALVVQQAGELSVQQVVDQAAKIQEVMKAVMHKDEHYGVIPGTKKPTLLKAGAEKLCLVFRLDPQYSIIEKMTGDHLTIFSTCVLYHIPTGNRMGSGMGSCSTKEQKYAYRQAGRACPACGLEGSIQRSKFGNKGWYCYAKMGGCGVEFEPDDKTITEQDTKRVANPDIADQYNTVLKMANKRSLIAAVLNVTAASDLFTQDLEDLRGKRGTVSDDGDPGDDFHASSDAGDGSDFSQAFHDEMEHHQPDAGVKATRIALIKKAKDKLGDQGMTWLSAATKDLGKTSETLTIDDMLALSERLTKLKLSEARA
jgi:hypothetical protein